MMESKEGASERDEASAASGRARARDARSILTKATGFIRDGGRGFDLTINVASGCTLDCAYCYVPAIFRVTRPDLADAWGEFVEVKSNAPALLREAVSKGKTDGKAIYLSSVTEPFLPAVEPVTRALLEILAERPPRRLVLQTHLHRVARHVDVLRALGPVVAISLSVPTDSERVRRRFEPKAPPIAKRLDALRVLTEAGIEAYLTVAPMLPVEDPAGFARATRGIARAALFSPLHAPNQSG
ncbi:MAG: radical SAM protein, partial [Myxococcales bacterium]|nr:radical SAM protein [Myxococcales bacterium]